MLEIISRVTEWGRWKGQAMAWYRAQPLPAFGGRTAEALVNRARLPLFGTISIIWRSAALREVCRDILPGA